MAVICMLAFILACILFDFNQVVIAVECLL